MASPRLAHSARSTPSHVAAARRALHGAPRGTSLLVALSLSAAACGDNAEDDFSFHQPPNRVSALSALPSLRVRAEVTMSEFFAPATSKLRVTIDFTANESTGIDDGEQWYCPQLAPSFGAELGGQPLPPLTRGGWINGPLEGTYRCLRAFVELPLTAAQQVQGQTLTVHDDSLAVTVPLDDLLVPRQMALVGGDAWSFFEGDPFAVAWAPAADLDGRAASQLALSFRDAHHAELIPMTGTVRPTDGTIELAMPRPAPVYGEGMMTIKLQRRLTPCPSCVIDASYEVVHTALVRPRT
jgi:hypothetical protein